MTSFLVEGRFTNMAWLLSTSPAVTMKRSLWPRKTLPRLRRLSSRFTRACSPLTWRQMLQVYPGREFMGSVTKEMENHKTYIRRGRTEIHRDQALLSVLTARLHSASLTISMSWKCFCLRANGLLHGSKGSPCCQCALITMRWPALQKKSLLLQSKRRQSPENRQQSIPGLSH